MKVILQGLVAVTLAAGLECSICKINKHAHQHTIFAHITYSSLCQYLVNINTQL